MNKILLVEDDKELNSSISSYLSSYDYEVKSCFNGLEALEYLKTNDCNILISDIMMPLMDGFTLAEKVRKTNSQLPILFITARDDKPSKQLGFKIGIDDYLTKPFDIDELVMRVGALLRRANINNTQKLVVGNFEMNKEEHTAYIDGEEINLTVREFDILFKLLSFPKKIFTRSALMDEFWDFDSSATSRTLDVSIAKIRDKIIKCDGFVIQTIHGLGYKVVLNEKK